MSRTHVLLSLLLLVVIVLSAWAKGELLIHNNDVHATAYNNSEVPKFKQSGLTFTNDKYCPNVTYSSDVSRESLFHLSTTGANFVSIVVTQYQQYHNSTEIFPLYANDTIYSSYYTYVTATDEELAVAITQAHHLEMKVMLKPQVDLTEDPEYWRGQIGEGFNEDQWDQWFRSYSKMLLSYAHLAQQLQVEQFSISCELVTASTQADHWRALISDVRRVYSGVLTDAANWGWLNATGGEETNKTWWDAVDLIGVDAYYPLLPANETGGNKPPALEEIIRAWQPIVERLQNLSLTFNRPVILTEVGYCSGSCQRGTVPTPDDLDTQSLYYEAAIRALGVHQDWFHGMFWWNWPTDAAAGGEDDVCMTPQFKPAEWVLRKYYRATQPIPQRPSYPPVCLCTV